MTRESESIDALRKELASRQPQVIPHDEEFLELWSQLWDIQARYLADAADKIYSALWPWYADARRQAQPGRVSGDTLKRAHAEWRELTGLPALDSARPDNWLPAGVAAGIPAADVRQTEIERVADVVTDWAIATHAPRARVSRPATPAEPAAPAVTESLDGLPPDDPQAKAIGYLITSPEWPDTQIAKAVGVSRQTLYKPNWWRFRQAREALKAGRQERPRGVKDADGSLEAWNEN